MEAETTDKKHKGRPLTEAEMKEWEKTWKDIDNAVKYLEEHGKTIYKRK